MGKSCGFGRIASGLLLGVAVGLARCPRIPAGCWAADSVDVDGWFPFKSGPPGPRLKPLVGVGSGGLTCVLASPRAFPTGCVGGRQRQRGSEWPCDLNQTTLPTACWGGVTRQTVQLRPTCGWQGSQEWAEENGRGFDRGPQAGDREAGGDLKVFWVDVQGLGGCR